MASWDASATTWLWPFDGKLALASLTAVRAGQVRDLARRIRRRSVPEGGAQSFGGLKPRCAGERGGAHPCPVACPVPCKRSRAFRRCAGNVRQRRSSKSQCEVVTQTRLAWTRAAAPPTVPNMPLCDHPRTCIGTLSTCLDSCLATNTDQILLARSIAGTPEPEGKGGEGGGISQRTPARV